MLLGLSAVAALTGIVALFGTTPPIDVQRPHDEPPALALAWTSDTPSCPSREALIERIAEQGVADAIGEWVPITHPDAKLAVDVVVTPDGDRFAATLRLTDADGDSTRRFSASTCAALVDATALIVAVTLDPIAVSAALHSSEQPEPDPTPEPAPTPDPEPDPDTLPTRALETEPTVGIDLVISDEPPPRPRRSEPLRFGVSIHGGGGYGPIDAGSGLVGGRVAMFGPRWRAELGGRWAIPRRIEASGAAGSFDGWMIEARGCFVPSVRTILEFPLCPGIELGSVRGRGVAPTSSPDQRAFLWIAPTLSQALLVSPIERLAIGAELGLVVSTTQGQFVVGDTPIAELARIGARGLVVVELRFP